MMVRLWTKRAFLSGMPPFVGKYMKVVRLSICWTLETRKTFRSVLSNMVEKLKRLKAVETNTGWENFMFLCMYPFAYGTPLVQDYFNALG